MNGLVAVKDLVVRPGTDLEADCERHLMRRLGNEEVLADIRLHASLEDFVVEGVPDGVLNDAADLLRDLSEHTTKVSRVASVELREGKVSREE